MPPRSSRGRARRPLAALAAAVLTAGAALTGLSPAATPAAAAPATDSVTITPNPATAGAQFQGWGNSLVWFANATGGYPDELRTELYEKLFGADGLNMNVARYNFGGGRATDVGDYFRQGAAVDGYWKDDTSTAADSLYGETTTLFADRLKLAEAWDPDNPEHYDWSKDSTQRWWLEQLSEKRDDLVLEGFVNSPPFFMTNSGYTSGNSPSNAEQVRTTNNVPAKFASYIARVAEHLEDTYQVEFQTLTPFNEPCTGYWGTTTGRQPDGITPTVPTSGPNKTQEGAQICAGSGAGQQQSLINLLAAELADSTSSAVVSANDETNPQNFNKAWKAYDATTRSNVGQINVHTYWDGGSREARDYAHGSEKPLWMSETGGDFVGGGFDPLSMNGGLGLAQKITNDLRQLQPEAYVLWQEVEDYYNMQQAAPRGENLNWGSIFIDFDCTYVDANGAALDSAEGALGFKSKRRVADAIGAGKPVGDVPDCSIVTNQKFNTMRNFMHFITAGDRLIQTDNTNATAAVRSDGSDLSLVYTNSSEAPRQVTIDLSDFATIDADASLTPYVTTQAPAINDLSTALVEGEQVAVDAATRSVTVTLPARSVATLEVDGVSGVADTAPQFVDGGAYQLIGMQSSKALSNGGESGLTITAPGDTAEKAATQTWTAHRIDLAGQLEGRDAFVLQSASDSSYAVFNANGSAVRSYASIDEAKADPAARWYPVTEDGGNTWVLTNGFNGNVLDVAGQGTAEGTKVGWYTNGYGANQRWSVRDVSTSPEAQPVSVRTQLGTAPELPATVTPVYGWGVGAPAAVTWELPGDEAWASTGTVTVHGAATDVFGNEIRGVSATVEVGPITAVDPASVKVLAGSTAAELREAVPATVDAQVGATATRFPVPVTWSLDAVADADLAAPGVITIDGTVAAIDTGGQDVAARLYVIVAEATGTTLLNTGCQASATYTEPNYSAARTCNGDLTDKAWSNWKSAPARTSDTLTYQLSGEPKLASAKVYFYKDGSHQSFPATFQAQYQAPGSDLWVDAGAPIAVAASSTAPVVDVPLAGVQAKAVRFVMTARPSTHMIVSEVQFYGPSAGPVAIADLARLTVNGTDVSGFAPDTTAYTVAVVGSGVDVTAVPLDRDATVAITGEGATRTITVTASDSSTEKVYTLTLERTVGLGSAAISGTPATGSELTASAVADPADATLGFQWLRDGEPIDGATSAAYTPVVADLGHGLSVRVTAEAEGYLAAQATSEPVEISDARVHPQLGISVAAGNVLLGDPVVATASISPAAAGTVEFLVDGEPAGSAVVADGAATVTLSGLKVGSHSVAARFTPAAPEQVAAASAEPVTVVVWDATQASLRLSASSVAQGASLTVTGTGFAPKEEVAVMLHSDPVLLGTATADADGSFTLNVIVPKATEVKAHSVVATGRTSTLSASAALTVTAVDGGQTPGDNGSTPGGNGTPNPVPGGTPGNRPGLPSSGAGAMASLAALAMFGGAAAFAAARIRKGRRDS